MQFIPDGPDIPDTLLQAHEEGGVVFFCGAGISYPAGLPDFKGLVEQIYRSNGTVFFDNEREAFDRGQFDTTLNLLERRLPGRRRDVRRKLAKALKPKLHREDASIDTQVALLRLARSREGALRLVTTNFDRVFHIAARRTKQVFHEYAAPMLPIPKNSSWDGLVYLHGLLPSKIEDAALDQLVVTSGDFGRAYLTERWAARFVSELFRNYAVCFVGYSINDPVLRYMMDALAANRMLGEATPQAWALGDCESGQEDSKTREWKAKGVTPILYKAPVSDDHSALHKTLQAWAETYRDGVLGKEYIVVNLALARPSASTQQDDFVGRMLWALSDKSGLPAKRFADFNPVPSLDWLDVFSDKRFQHSDLSRFCVPPHEEPDTQLRFSMISRPAPYDHAPLMQLVSGGMGGSQWDGVMRHLAGWLVRHLNDPRLIIWIAENGGQLYDSWSQLIEGELNRFAKLERDGKTAELDDIRSQAPNAIPKDLMRTLWRLLLTGRVKSLRRFPEELYRWKKSLERDGLTAALRLKLRELLAPQVVLKKPWGYEEESINAPELIKQLVDWELVLAAEESRTLRGLTDENWMSVLPLLLEDFEQLLCDAMDLLRELGAANDRSDFSNRDLPSISLHSQNQVSRDWVSLIELLRDAWLAVFNQDNARAKRIAQAWFERPYPTFKRLALFAASQDECIDSEQWVAWLLADGAWWLWSLDTMREVCRLLVLQGSQLTEATQERLEAAILIGPPREMYPNDHELDSRQELVARSVWLYLAKLNTYVPTLGTAAQQRLAELTSTYPEWSLANDERDEFSYWISWGWGDPDYEGSQDIDIAPRKRHDLVQWLKKPQSERRLCYGDTWSEVCSTRFFHSLFALSDLANDGVWLAERWREALQAWNEKGIVRRSWRYAAPLVQKMPDIVILEIARSVTRWLREASESIDRHEDILLNLCSRVLALPLEADTGIREDYNYEPINQPVAEAINHPVGHVTLALINLWFKRNPNDNDLLPDNVKHFFTKLCDVQVDRYRHGRVLLGSHLIAFFRVDRPWTEQYLLPLFSWSNRAEARGVWQGFLRSPCLYQPLLTAFKPDFLESAKHYTDLGEYRQRFAAFLTYAALGPTEGYTVAEFRAAIGALPQEGLEASAQALFQALEGTADQQREDYWKNRVQPFWQQVWPKLGDLATEQIAESLFRLAIAARGKFPIALDKVQDWLKPIKHPHYVVRLLCKSGLCRQYPKHALRLLNALITDQQRWVHYKLKECLNEIERASPALAQDFQYQRLREYSRR